MTLNIYIKANLLILVSNDDFNKHKVKKKKINNLL